MRSALIVAKESIYTLYQDKVFIPSIAVVIVMVAVAFNASDWGIFERRKIMMDMGTTFFRITGLVVAGFWGTKLLAEKQRDSTIHQLATPVSRASWIIGQYLSLGIWLACYGTLFVGFWWGLSFLLEYLELKPIEYISFLLLGMEWLVIASMTTFFSVVGSQPIALFSVISLWTAGCVTRAVASNLPNDAPVVTSAVVTGFTSVWDFSQFNLAPYLQDHEISDLDLEWRFIYSISLIIFFLLGAVATFERKDLKA